MSGPTTFSYAQAAKGTPTAKDLAKDRPTAAQPESQAKDDASSVTTGPDGVGNTFSTTSEISESAKSSQVDVEITGPKKATETAGKPVAPSVSSKDDSPNAAGEETVKTNVQPASERSARHSTRSGEPTDSKKGRKGRKGRSTEKEAEGEQPAAEPEKEVEPVKLTEAPQPVVNIWAQRAAAAKARQPSIVTSPVTSTESSSKAAVDAPSKTANSTGNQIPERAATKSTDARQSVDQSARRNPRGSRVSDKSEPPQSVPSSAAEDASMWPTPDTAAAEDGKRKVPEPEQPTKEKLDDGTKSIRSKRDWKKVEITPSVVFETPLPPPRTMNKARGGGQAGRSSASRGHASSVSMSSEKGQGAIPDGTATKEGAETRSRPREDAAPRTNPVPSDKAKKFSVDQQNQRKQSVPSVNRGSGDFASKSEAYKASKSDSTQFGPSRGEGPEGSRKEGGLPGHKDAKPRRGAHGNGNGRGGHNQQTFMSNGHGGPRSSTYSPPNFTSGFPPNQYGGSGRGGRGRGVPLSNGFKGPSNNAHKMHQHVQSASTDFGQYPPFGQAPYPPQLDPNPANFFQLIHQTLKKQMEYYFSEDNLVKDGFLRAHMDAQGFVPLDVIAAFRRVTTIAGNQPRDFLRQACADSPEIDFVLGDGHKELVRVRENWQKWVPETAKDGHNPGPTSFEYRSWHSMHLNPYPQQQPSQQPVPYPSYPMSPPAFGPSPFPGEMYPGYMNGPRFGSATNGAQANGYDAADNSSLNATVPEFSPVHTGSNGPHSALSSMNWMDQAMQAAQTHTDEQVAALHMVVKGQAAKESSKLSNGVTNGSEGTPAVKTNGVHAGSDAVTTYVCDTLASPELSS